MRRPHDDDVVDDGDKRWRKLIREVKEKSNFRCVKSDVDDDAGRGDGLVVSVFAFNSNDQSLNQTKVRNFYCVNFCLKSKKRGLEWPLPKMTWYLRLICW